MIAPDLSILAPNILSVLTRIESHRESFSFKNLVI
jgi:hypothetical protein